MTDDGRTEREEAIHFIGMELRTARTALWHGETGKAFASVEAAQEAYERLQEVADDD